MDEATAPGAAPVPERPVGQQPDVAQPEAEPPVHGRKALLVGLLSGVVCVAFEAMAVTTAMPEAARELGSLGLYAWAFTVFVLGMTLATGLAGRVCDRVGPVQPLAVGALLFVLGLLLAGAAPSMLVLVAARFLQGLGGGTMNLCLMVVVAHAFDERERAGIMTWFSVCWVLPAFVGPPVSAAITRHWGWHWVFWSLVPCLLLAAAISARPLLELQRRHQVEHEGADPVPVWAAVLAAAAAAALQGAGQLLGVMGLLLGLAAVVALVVAVPRLMPSGFARLRPGLSAVVWTRALQAGAFFATESFLPLSLVQERGMSLFRAGLALTAGSLGWTFGSWVQSRPWLRWRRDQLIIAGLAFTALGVGAVDAAAWFPRGTLPLVAVGWTLAGLGMGMAIASGSLAVMKLSEPAQLGRNTSSLQTAEGLGNSLVAGLVGSIFHTLHATASSSTTFGWVFLVTCCSAVLGLGAAWRIGPVRNDSARPTA